MGDTPHPTRAGMHNHIGSAVKRAVPAPHIDRVFGVDAPIIEGLPIEVGHGCNPVPWQLAEHVARIFATEGRDAARALMLKLLLHTGIDQLAFANELVARNLMSVKTADGRRALEAFAPVGPGN
jgi:hypothetical protein